MSRTATGEVADGDRALHRHPIVDIYTRRQSSPAATRSTVHLLDGFRTLALTVDPRRSRVCAFDGKPGLSEVAGRARAECVLSTDPHRPQIFRRPNASSRWRLGRRLGRSSLQFHMGGVGAHGEVEELFGAGRVAAERAAAGEVELVFGLGQAPLRLPARPVDQARGVGASGRVWHGRRLGRCVRRTRSTRSRSARWPRRGAIGRSVMRICADPLPDRRSSGRTPSRLVCRSDRRSHPPPITAPLAGAVTVVVRCRERWRWRVRRC